MSPELHARAREAGLEIRASQVPGRWLVVNLERGWVLQDGAELPGEQDVAALLARRAAA